MKKVYRLILFAGLLVSTGGIGFWGTGCDDIKGPCEIEDEKSGTLWHQLRYLESWRKEGNFGILRFFYPDKTIFFVCTDRSLSFEADFKLMPFSVFTVAPEARLIWKYEAPKPSSAILSGGGIFKPLIKDIVITIKEQTISLAYSESALGGVFVPGFEIKIPTSGNQSDDYKNFSWNIWDGSGYSVKYRMNY